MLLGVIFPVVHAEHDREVGVCRGRRDDDLLRAGVDVLLRAFAVREESGRLDHDVDTEVVPRKSSGIALRQELQLAAADDDGAVAHLHRFLERAEHRVVAQEVGHRLRVAEVVRSHDLEVPAARELRAQKVPPDPSEPVDPHPDLRHVYRSLSSGFSYQDANRPVSWAAPDTSDAAATRTETSQPTSPKPSEQSAAVAMAKGGRTGKLRGRPSRSLTTPETVATDGV